MTEAGKRGNQSLHVIEELVASRLTTWSRLGQRGRVAPAA
jgi:hypothetical protein